MVNRFVVLVLFAASPHFAEEFVGKVVGVSDGDTIRVLHDGQEKRVRLWVIDAPEAGQPFGARAKRFTSDLAFGKQVTLRVRELDRYRRIVAEVVLPNGKTLNHEIVRVGFAWWFQRYAPRDQILPVLEYDAREPKRGLWADGKAVAPWEWRKRAAASR